MCIIVDTNSLGDVFKKRSVNHQEFKPVLDWVVYGRGVLIYGGTKYLKEIKDFLDIFVELGKRRKAINIETNKVDESEAWAATQIKHPNFDDQHLVGLLLTSGCKLICTQDLRAIPYLTHRLFFSTVAKRPKIYRGRRNSDLLTDNNMTVLCKPGIKLSAIQRKGLNFLK